MRTVYRGGSRHMLMKVGELYESMSWEAMLRLLQATSRRSTPTLTM